MITAISIENFKGIGERFRLPIKPITLLFGANSAGKSTILQAIHYAREVLDRHNLNANRTESGGPFVNLGGFANFVHRRDRRRQITLRFEMHLGGRPLPEFTYWDEQIEDDVTKRAIHGFQQPQTAAVEFSVASCERGLYVSKYAADLNGERIATIFADLDTSREGWVSGGLLDVNFDHPILKSLDPTLRQIEAQLDENDSSRSLGQWTRLTGGGGRLDVCEQDDALPELRDGLIVYSDGVHGDDSPLGRAVLDSLFSRLVVGPAVLVLEELKEMRYLGPLRATPPRDYMPPHPPDASRWTTGLGAWDVLHGSEGEFVKRVNHWLCGEHRLKTGYEVLVHRYAELDFESELRQRILSCDAARDPQRLARDVSRLPAKKRVMLFKRDGEGDVAPEDVGTGMSQVLPIVVACLDPGNRLTCIEQPELHLHPRLQCELGDLLIKGSVGHTMTRPKWVSVRDPNEGDVEIADEDEEFHAPRVVMVETHSEHLILRIMRRIRETTRGQPHNGISITPNDVAVIYVGQVDGQTVAETIPIDEHGEFTREWPDNFFESDFYERIS